MGGEDNVSLLSGGFGDVSLGSVLTLRLGDGGRTTTVLGSSRNSSLNSRLSSLRSDRRRRSAHIGTEASPRCPPSMRLIPRAATVEAEGPLAAPVAEEEEGFSSASLLTLKDIGSPPSRTRFDLKNFPISEEPSSLMLASQSTAAHPKSLAARPWASMRNTPSPFEANPTNMMGSADIGDASSSTTTASKDRALSKDPPVPEVKDKDSLAGIEEIQDISENASPDMPTKFVGVTSPKIQKDKNTKGGKKEKCSKQIVSRSSSSSSDTDSNFVTGEDTDSGGEANADTAEKEDEIDPAGLPKETRRRKNALISILNPTFLLPKRRKKTKAEKRARKAFRTITIIVGAFAIFWSPYYIVATIYGFCADCVPSAIFLTSYYLCYLNSSGNPFAYALANRQFRNAFIRIFKGDLRRSAHHA